jgi:ADP-ribose pyrophosphatase YjhB (NUDIX family)
MSLRVEIGPSPRVYGVCIHDGAVLLVRATTPHDGGEIWWLPGGGIDWGESPQQTLEREFIEETGLRVTNHLLHSVLDDQRVRVNGDHVHTVRIIYFATVEVAPLQHEAGGTTDFVMWAKLNELNRIRVADYAQSSIEAVVKMLTSTETNELGSSLAPFRVAANL